MRTRFSEGVKKVLEFGCHSPSFCLCMLSRFLAEDRQEQNAKRRKLEANGEGSSYVAVKASPSLQLTINPTPSAATPALVSTPTPATPMRHALPPRPTFDSFESTANAFGFGTTSPTVQDTAANKAAAITGITGSAHDWVANRRAFRMANMSAAEMLKAEMMAATPISKPPPRPSTTAQPIASPMAETPPVSLPTPPQILDALPSVLPTIPSAALPPVQNDTEGVKAPDNASTTTSVTTTTIVETEPMSPHGTKRKHEEVEKESGGDDVAEETFEVDPEDDDDAPSDTSITNKRKVNNDGTVEQEDTVK